MKKLQAIELGKAYRRYEKPSDCLKEWLFRKTYHEDFWALKALSFHCNTGEVLGVIGDNGAGKSTLLKLLAGTVKPTIGRLLVDGRVSAILELGSGFHPEYTGLENIRLGCAMLGLTAEEIALKTPEIIEFSELGDFIFQPVKSFSSGMFVRLAFSVVTSVDPDILIVDEALSVGDQHFQKKSMDRMMAFKEQGKSLIFCSHNLYHVKELCNRSIWLDNGIVQMQGHSGDVVDAYNDHVRMQNRVSVAVTQAVPQVAPVGNQSLTAWITEAELVGIEDLPADVIYKTGQRFSVSVKAQLNEAISLDDVHIGIVIKRNDDVQCFGTSTVLDGIELFKRGVDEYGVVYVIDKLSLLSGHYSLDVWLVDSTSAHVYDSRQSCCPFTVRHHGTEIGVTFFAHQWQASL